MGMGLARAYLSLGTTPLRYIVRFALPVALAGVAVPVVLTFLVPGLFAGQLGLLFWLLPGFFFVVAILFPYLRAESRRHEINRNIHFWITHMGVLATSNLPRTEIVRMLAEKKEYGALADETRKILALVEAWNMGLADACRFVSKRTPSEILSDFLDRFAYSLESGEDLEHFLANEQRVVLHGYSAFYRASLYELEHLKNLYNSVMMSAVFVVIFAILTPMLTGLNATLLMGGATFLVGFLSVTFFYFTKSKAPSDPVWLKSTGRTPLDRRILLAAVPAVLFALPATLAVLVLTSWPYPVAVAVGVTPLALAGFVMGNAEDAVKRRDDNFAAFVRSLGSSAAANGGQLVEVLRHLSHHDFGPLTENVRQLHNRLSLRVDDSKAWGMFAAECGSNLIEKFSRMFVEAVRAGGKPDRIGAILSENFVDILALRKARYQTASGFRGLLYGLCGGTAMALFVGLAILTKLGSIVATVPAETSPFPVEAAQADTVLLGLMVTMLLMLLALVSSLMLRAADGGSWFRSWTDFVGMMWLAVFVGILAEQGLGGLLA